MPPDSVQQPRQSPAIYRTMIFGLGIFIVLLALYRMTDDSASPTNIQTERLRKISVVPPFALTERSGKTITNRDLDGKVWVADFVYTTCPGPCPLVTANMAQVQKAVANDPHVQLVTITVDPTVDTADVLSKYADKYGADPNRWWFLTGNEKQIDDLITHGFLQAVQDNRGAQPSPGQFTVTHSTNFALVDAEGNVRGYYDAAAPSDHADMLNDIKTLEQEAGL